MTAKRVLMLSGEWPDTVGGIARHVGLLEERLPELGWQVCRFDLQGGDSRPALAASLPRLIRGYRSAAERCQVVHNHDLVLGNILAQTASQPVVTTLHSSSQASWFESARLSAKLSRRAVARASARIAVSPDTLEMEASLGQFAYCPNGVEVPALPSEVESGQVAGPRAVFARRLVPKNGLLDLLDDMLAAEPGRRPALDVVAAGSQADVRAADAAITDRGLHDWVKLIPPFPPARWAEVLRQYRVAVVPSSWDAVCFGVLEPLAAGVRVVARPFPAAVAVLGDLPPNQARLVPSDARGGLAHAVAELTEKPLLPDERRELRESVRPFSADAMARCVAAVYDSIGT